MTDERLKTAEDFLQEAVFRSRAAQAAGTSLFAAAKPDAAGCGLGVRAEVVLELSPRGAELFAHLFERELAAEEVERVRGVMRAWIERADALDRKRNHFLKAFRGRHGFDRNAYAPDQLAEFEQGLAAVNAEVERERTEFARRLVAAP